MLKVVQNGDLCAVARFTKCKLTGVSVRPVFNVLVEERADYNLGRDMYGELMS